MAITAECIYVILLLGSAKVCIETVLAYRTKRGFRGQPVVPEWQDGGDKLVGYWGGIPWKKTWVTLW